MSSTERICYGPMTQTVAQFVRAVTPVWLTDAGLSPVESKLLCMYKEYFLSYMIGLCLATMPPDCK